MQLSKLLTIFSLFSTCLSASAQDIVYAQEIVDTLSSPYFHGRGYVADGDRKAAIFIAHEMKSNGLQDIKTHAFSFNVNTFPSQMCVTSNLGALNPGGDFLIDPASPDMRFSSTQIFRIGSDNFETEEAFKKLKKKNFRRLVALLDTVPNIDILIKRRKEFIDGFKGKCLVEVRRDLTWAVSRIQTKQPHLWVLPGILDNATSLSADVNAKFINNYKTANVLGVIPGTVHSDSFIVITGHYDHLGRMGSDTYMPGANDNASGIAMMLDLASEFQTHPPEYTIYFIAFAGEEAGLVGSYSFVQDMDNYLNSDKIRFLINMDLMGSGEEGIMAVNGKVFISEFEDLERINDEHGYLSEVKSRGKAANSDHYFFTEAGVPGFFFYLMGSYSYYHDVDDSGKNLHLREDSYNNSFLLIRDFIRELMSGQ